ncbi:hypothetical protein F5Y11DRAFT_362973 [Daldinia sp. FL1419]|nr:hypothetical protein F5Y11DRAFT_362973 [Daldinia sp. FL1419]
MKAQIPFYLSSTQLRNPAQGSGKLNYARCATLNNEPLERLEYDSDKPEARVLHRRDRFEYYGDDAERVRHRLSPPLVAFLERALVVDDHSLHYYVAGLSGPDCLWLYREGDNTDAEPDRYLTLYAATGIASELDGLVFDQKEKKAIMQMSLFDYLITQNGRQKWFPLEVILSAWLTMTDKGKGQAFGPGIERPNEIFDPWASFSWTYSHLFESLGLYRRLLGAIESRMPAISRS